MAALSNTKTVETLTPHANSPPKQLLPHQHHHLPPTSNKATTTTPRSSVDRPSERLLHLNSRRSHHASSASTSSLPRITSQRSSGGIFSRAAAAAIDKTQSAFGTISEPVLRPRQSNPTLARLSLVPSSDPAGLERSALSSKTPSSHSLSSNGDYTVAGGQNPPSRPYTDADPSLPAPIKFARSDPKMHQTSSRLLRMTDDDRPYTRVSLSHLYIRRAHFAVLVCWALNPQEHHEQLAQPCQ